MARVPAPRVCPGEANSPTRYTRVHHTITRSRTPCTHRRRCGQSRPRRPGLRRRPTRRSRPGTGRVTNVPGRRESTGQRQYGTASMAVGPPGLTSPSLYLLSPSLAISLSLPRTPPWRECCTTRGCARHWAEVDVTPEATMGSLPIATHKRVIADLHRGWRQLDRHHAAALGEGRPRNRAHLLQRGRLG